MAGVLGGGGLPRAATARGSLACMGEGEGPPLAAAFFRKMAEVGGKCWGIWHKCGSNVIYSTGAAFCRNSPPSYRTVAGCRQMGEASLGRWGAAPLREHGGAQPLQPLGPIAAVLPSFLSSAGEACVAGPLGDGASRSAPFRCVGASRCQTSSRRVFLSSVVCLYALISG